jgi:DNA-binding transcriptional MerR regulator
MNMHATALESRPLYGIGIVARLTRIRPETLRIWERRYGLGASQKADNGRRRYTQTDLEHLQIVCRLVEQGFRIGEIASMERKTLEAMLDQGGATGARSNSQPKPRVLFLGEVLCKWLDQHPGCLSGLDSQLYRGALDGVDAGLSEELPEMDLLIVDCGALGDNQIEIIERLKARVKARATLVFYQFSKPACLSQLEADGTTVAKLPLDTRSFAEQMKRLQESLELERGVGDAGELSVSRGRLFKDADLVKYLNEESSLECGCTRHLSGIIQSLAHFEQYSSQCAVESWRDAATHTCVYAYTNQARWLMEKALQAALEGHEAQHEG